ATVGADEPLSTSLSATTNGLPTLFSQGVAVTYAVSDTNADTLNDTLTATAGGGTGVTLHVNTDGTWSFDLDDQLDHVDNGLNDENFTLRTNLAGTTSVSTIDFSSIVVMSDKDGDDLTLDAGSFTIAVQDDIPVQNQT